MDTKQMLKEIYSKIADKTLSFGCILKYNGDMYILVDTNKLLSYVDDKIYENEYDYKYLSEMEYEIIGHPISLSRVLSALGNTYYYHQYYSHIYHEYDLDIYTDWNNGIISKGQEFCQRILLNQDNSDAMLDDQSPETIKAIYDILLPTK